MPAVSQDSTHPLMAVARDSDGDGWSDADELAAGLDPRDPSDHRVELLASGPAESPPGMIELSATVVNGEGCTVAWTQLGGPAAAFAGEQFRTRSAGQPHDRAVSPHRGQRRRIGRRNWVGPASMGSRCLIDGKCV